jgi:hypothetical protein
MFTWILAEGNPNLSLSKEKTANPSLTPREKKIRVEYFCDPIGQNFIPSWNIFIPVVEY